MEGGVTDSPRVFTADRGDARRRLDLMLGRHLADLHRSSRTRLQTWIASGQVCVNGAPVLRSAARVALGDVISLVVPAHDANIAPRRMDAEDTRLDVLYEDDYLLALDKPAGMVVHPGYKNATGTVMNALLGRAREWPAPQRPSIVGRLDKLTSGIVVVAKTAHAHAALQRAMAADAAEKEYLAVVYGRVSPASGTIDFRLRRDPQDRRRMLASNADGARSVTRFERIARAAAPRAGLSVVRCTIATGRMHQIRVHLAARGWPIVGDPVYGEPRWSTIDERGLAATLRTFPRQALHAWRLSLTHPMTGERIRFEAPVPRDLQMLLSLIPTFRARD